MAHIKFVFQACFTLFPNCSLIELLHDLNISTNLLVITQHIGAQFFMFNYLQKVISISSTATVYKALTLVS